MAQFAGIWLDYDFSGSENNFDKSAYVSFDESFKIVSAKENRIVVSFNAMTYGNIDEYVNKDNGGMTYTFEFTKIDDGWRISGGTFVDEYFVYKSWYRIHYAPQTGSEAPVLIAAAVLSLGLVLCIRRRRRAA